MTAKRASVELSIKEYRALRGLRVPSFGELVIQTRQPIDPKLGQYYSSVVECPHCRRTVFRVTRLVQGGGFATKKRIKAAAKFRRRKHMESCRGPIYGIKASP